MRTKKSLKQKIKYYKFGLIAEYISIIILFFKGYKILENRYKTKLGEVDIIASKASHIIFVEVKARKEKTQKEVLTNAQQKRIADAAIIYMSKNPQYSNHNIRFDLIIFHSPITLNHIKNAWEI